MGCVGFIVYTRYIVCLSRFVRSWTKVSTPSYPLVTQNLRQARVVQNQPTDCMVAMRCETRVTHNTCHVCQGAVPRPPPSLISAYHPGRCKTNRRTAWQLCNASLVPHTQRVLRLSGGDTPRPPAPSLLSAYCLVYITLSWSYVANHEPHTPNGRSQVTRKIKRKKKRTYVQQTRKRKRNIKKEREKNASTVIYCGGGLGGSTGGPFMPEVLTGLKRPLKKLATGLVDGARFSIGVIGSSGNIFAASRTGF